MIRLLASSVASSADMDIDNVDDLRIAADELCYLLMSSGATGEDLELEFTASASHVLIEGRRRGWGEGEALPTPSDLMVKILAQVVDDFGIFAETDTVGFRAKKDAALMAGSAETPPA